MTAAISRRSVGERAAVPMGVVLIAIGIVHFASPRFFDEIVPPWLPLGQRFWTLASGVAEVLVGFALLWSRTRRRAGWAAALLFVAVYPGNLYMAWDWRDRAWTEQIVAWIRLPFQFPLIWLAVRIARDVAPDGDPS